MNRIFKTEISSIKQKNQQKLVSFFVKTIFIQNFYPFDFISRSEIYLNFPWFPSVFPQFRPLYPRPLSFFLRIKQWESKSNWLAFVLCVYCICQNICKMPCLAWYWLVECTISVLPVVVDVSMLTREGKKTVVHKIGLFDCFGELSSVC